MKVIYGTTGIFSGTTRTALAGAGLPRFSSSSVRLPRGAKSRAVSHRCVSSGMEASAGTALYPLHCCKTIYLVRHAQGIHNVEGEKDFNAYMSQSLFDARLTPLGWKQANWSKTDLEFLYLVKMNNVDLVFLSVDWKRKRDKAASLHAMNSMLVDGLREHVKKCGLAKKVQLVISSPLLRTMQTAVGVFGGENYTDGMKVTFACLIFSQIENDKDVLWEPDVREANETVAMRGMKFIDW
ncbi:hypothetical protein PR202_gb25745 [Eleusine coracana subsp. coracana]|uniref:Phosphoglycerate mutase-like protein n=1 Tax=Eleusine coracana subsp. coracana TaxID=191504 RepID=A0AAV5FQ20_ELECO|nr:hypothetical protein PR202_gb25745 [Eleusine coracana subsp. coracana]